MNDGLFPNTLGKLSIIGIRFDLDKVASAAYGLRCWKILWECFDPSELCTSELFDGDTKATLHGRENVFCIAIRNLDSELGNNIREALVHSRAFSNCAADPPFIDGPDCLQALQTAGRIDATGELIGTDAAWVRAALGEVRIEKRRQSPSRPPKEASSRMIPASKRTAALPTLDRFDDFASKILGWDGLLQAQFTPEELCDVVEHYAQLLTVQVAEYSCANSECMLSVSLYPKNDTEREGESFIGMYPFGSEMDAIRNCRSRLGDDVSPEELKCLMDKRGILGKWHRNFETYGSAAPESLDADKQLPPAELWAWLFHRAEQKGIPIPTSQSGQAEIPPPETEAQRVEGFMAAVAADEALGELAKKNHQSARRSPTSDANYVRFSCDHCGKRLKARPQDVAKTGTCTSCGQRTTVREESGPSTLLRFPCPACEKTLKAPVSMSGTRAKCPNCGELVQVLSGPTLQSMSSLAKRNKQEGVQTQLQELFTYLQNGSPAEIANYEDSDCVRNQAKFLEALSVHSGSPCLTYFVMNGNSGKGATHKHLIVTTGEKAHFDRDWNYNTDEIRDRVLRDLSLPVGRWDKLTGDGCGSYANHSKPGCTLASTVPFDNLAEGILHGEYELTQVIRPAQDSGEEHEKDRWDVLIIGDEIVCPDLACDFCGDARVVPGHNGSHLRCCNCGTVYCKRNCQATIHGQCPRCGEADRIDCVELPQ